MRLLGERKRLFRVQTGEAIRNHQHRSEVESVQRVRNEPEHPDLFDDVVPLARRLQLVSEYIIQLVAQGDDPMCHRLDVSLPFLE